MFFVNSDEKSTGGCIFLVLLLLRYKASSTQFTQKYQGKTVTGLVGSSVNFTWSFSGNVYSIEWGIKKYGVNDFKTSSKLVLLDPTGSVSIPVPAAYVGRVSGTRPGGSSSTQVVFTLGPVKKEDENLYGCRITSDAVVPTTVFDYVQLVVEVPPDITHISGNQRVNDGDEVRLNCSADGKPKPNITWTRVSDNSVVTFPLTISKLDSGVYRCIADNGIGNPATAEVFIAVQYQATIHNISSSVSKSWIGQTVTLTCKSDGVPTPTMTWYKPDGTKLNPVKANNNTFVVTMNSDKDFGLYNCTADNGFVLASKTVHVRQIEAPGLPIITVDIQATSLIVKWSAPADDGGSPITAYRVVILQGDTEIAKKNVTDPE